MLFPPDPRLLQILLLYNLSTTWYSLSFFIAVITVLLFSICLPCWIVRSVRANCHAHYFVPAAVPGTKQIFKCLLNKGLLISSFQIHAEYSGDAKCSTPFRGGQGMVSLVKWHLCPWRASRNFSAGRSKAFQNRTASAKGTECGWGDFWVQSSKCTSGWRQKRISAWVDLWGQ